MVMERWLIGCVIVVVGSIVSNLGVNLQKLAHVQMQHRQDVRAKYNHHKNNIPEPYINSKLWICGLFLSMAGAVADFIALLFAPQSLIAPLGSSTLLANVFFAHFLLNEEVLKSDVGATMAIIVGSILTTLSADHSNQGHTLREMKALFTRLPFLFYLVAVMCVFILILALILRESRQLHTKEDMRNSKIMPFGYAALSGICGAQSLLFAKMVAECINEMLAKPLSGSSSENPFHEMSTYFIILALVAMMLLQTHLQNLGLRQYDAVIVFPIFQIFWILFSVLGGLVYFQEFARLQVNQASLFCLAIGVICIGVYFLAQHEAQQVVRKIERVVSTVWVVMALNRFKKIVKKKLTLKRRKATDEETDITPSDIEMVPVQSKAEKFERIRRFGQMVQDAMVANDEKQIEVDIMDNANVEVNADQHPVLRFFYGLFLGAEMNLYHMSSFDGHHHHESRTQTRNVSEDESSLDEHDDENDAVIA